jgi:hypothetical protein
MLNNPILDVAIGLVFIFLLYSLLATTINEFVSTIFSYRPRMLEMAIERMLDGKNYSYYWWDKLINIFLWIYYWSEFFIKWIVSLIKKTKQDASQKTVAPGNVLRFIKNKPDSPKNFRRHKLNSKAALFAAKFTSHPMYKRAAENSILNKKPAYLTAAVFSDILLDILSPATGKPVLLSEIQGYIQALPKTGPGALPAETREIVNIYINQANGDLQRFKLLLEDWYNDTMNRVSGWYKRQSYKVLLLIGLILAVTFNIDTIEIVRTLSKDKVAREAMVKNASAYLQQQTQPQTGQGTVPANNTAVNTPKTIDAAKIEKDLAKIRDLYEKSIAEQNTTLGLGWSGQMKSDSVAWKNDRALGKTRFDFPVYFAAKRLPPALPGFFITALAISLGAPFWFDLLNKFVNLRVSGKRPDDDKAPVSKTTAFNQKPQPNSFG